MAGTFYSHIITLKCSWDQVALSLWRRYPNPYSKHVLSEDIVSRKVKDNKISSKRLLSKTNRLPKWAEPFVGEGTRAMIIEESVVDSRAKTFITYTRNITHTRLMSVIEKCTYYVSPDDSKETCCLKQAWIKCGIFGISRAIEKYGLERYKKNAHKSELGLQFIFSKLFNTSDNIAWNSLPKKKDVQ